MDSFSQDLIVSFQQGNLVSLTSDSVFKYLYIQTDELIKTWGVSLQCYILLDHLFWTIILSIYCKECYFYIFQPTDVHNKTFYWCFDHCGCGLHQSTHTQGLLWTLLGWNRRNTHCNVRLPTENPNLWLSTYLQTTGFVRLYLNTHTLSASVGYSFWTVNLMPYFILRFHLSL